jgi:preprotein translocase subunit SecF
MIRIFKNPNYDFIKWWKVAAAATIAFILLGLASFAVTGGVNYSIEFTGGTMMQLSFAQPPDVAVIRSTLDQAGVTGAEIQQFGSPRDFTIRAQDRARRSAVSCGAAR